MSGKATKVSFSIWIDPSDLRLLDAAAKWEKLNRSDFVRRLIREYAPAVLKRARARQAEIDTLGENGQ